uniref:CW-type domain-containing protein n=1 Tax=Crocodylus porosus TaxID=8502 RepID=A0A7M4E8M4_CROPO
MDSVIKNSFYLNKIWVQCENGNCLKWRLLPTDDAAQVDHSEPWYCYMNTDPWFNKCSVSEKCFPEESEFHKNGFKYIYSRLSIGSLVLKLMFTSLYICKGTKKVHLTEVPRSKGLGVTDGYFSLTWRISLHFGYRIITS